MAITETERLLIRELGEGDTPALSKILGDPSVMEFSRNGALSEADTAGFIEWCAGHYREHGYGQWALVEKSSGALIGFCGLSRTTVDSVDEVEVAYRLARAHWGRGLASEAARAVLAQGFSELGIEAIVGIVSPRHLASIRVLEKIGFRSFSETRYSGWDVRVYRLTRREWTTFAVGGKI